MTNLEWTIRSRPDLDAYARERQAANLSADLMTAEFINHFIDVGQYRHLKKARRTMGYLGMVLKGLEDFGVEWHRWSKRRVRFQPIFSCAGTRGDEDMEDIIEQWFVARFEHSLNHKRGGFVFERIADGKVFNTFTSLDDARDFIKDPDAVFGKALDD